jgi:hypothetical protein
MTYTLRVTKVCSFNSSEPYSDYNRQYSRSIHLFYVETEDSLWAYRACCHLDEKNKVCLETQMSDYEVIVLQEWLREN